MRVLLFLLIINTFCYALEINEIKNICNNYGYGFTREVLDFFKIRDLDVDNKCFVKRLDFKSCKVRFKGNLVYLDSTLKRVANIKNNEIRSDKIDLVVKRVKDFYVKNGYLDTVVTHKIEKDSCIININEGKLYVITKVEAVNLPIEYKSSKLDIFTTKRLNELLDDITKKLNENGYFNVILTYDLEPTSYNYPFFDKDKIFSSVFSLLPFFHQVVKIKVYMKQGEKYDLIIKGVKDKKIKSKLKRLFIDEVKQIDSFNIGVFKIKAKELLNKLGFEKGYVTVSIYKNDIIIKVNYLKRYRDIKINVNVEPFNKKIYDFALNFIEQDIYNFDLKLLNNELRKIGFEEGFLKTTISKASVLEKDNVYYINVNIKIHKQIKKIKVFLNGKELFSTKVDGIKIDYEQIKYKINSILEKKYYYTYVELVNQTESNDSLRLYFNSDIQRLILKDIIYFHDANIYKPAIKRYFKKDKYITVEKINKIRSYLKRVGFYSESGVKVSIFEDKGILLIYNKVKNKNQIYGGFGFTNVSGLNLYLGYRRFDLFNHNFNSLIFKSSNEFKFHLKLLGYNFLAEDLFDEEGAIYSEKIKVNYDIRSKKVYLQLSKSINEHFVNVQLFYENLNEYNIDFNIKDLKKYNGDDIFALGINVRYNKFDITLNPSNGYSLKLANNLYYSDKTFSSLNISATFYKRIKNYLLNISGDIAKFYMGENYLPLSYRYTLGGPSYMKGYGFEKIGKKDINGRVYGGNSKTYFELGLSRFLVKNVLFGVFFETGNATDNFADPFFYKDIGAKLEIRTPIGPFKLSYANNYLFNNLDKSQAFYISFGQIF
ncbi:BamA/TamA family outer membrane protein [Deferribacter thermophilus]|uniref:outer membrane protein assembly factor n=1 Tax=Deferribacter thermophilus TaxID=53573 RepID=UPI003C27F449